MQKKYDKNEDEQKFFKNYKEHYGDITENP